MKRYAILKPISVGDKIQIDILSVYATEKERERGLKSLKRTFPSACFFTYDFTKIENECIKKYGGDAWSITRENLINKLPKEVLLCLLQTKEEKTLNVESEVTDE